MNILFSFSTLLSVTVCFLLFVSLWVVTLQKSLIMCDTCVRFDFSPFAICHLPIIKSHPNGIGESVFIHYSWVVINVSRAQSNKRKIERSQKRKKKKNRSHNNGKSAVIFFIIRFPFWYYISTGPLCARIVCVDVRHWRPFITASHSFTVSRSIG